MAQEPTIIGSWLGVIMGTLGAYGVDGEAFVKSHGLDPRQTLDPDYRIGFFQLKSVWEAAVAATGDEGFGLRAGAAVHPTSFHALGMVLWSSSSLKQMFQYLARYFAVFSTAARMEFCETVEDYRLYGRYECDAEGQAYATDIGVDATLAAIMTICQSHYGDSFTPQRVELYRDRPSQRGVHEDFFRCPVSYGCEDNLMVMDKSQMEATISRGNPVLAQEMEKLITDYLARMDRGDVIGLIRAKLLVMLPEGKAEKAQVADSLSMSSRTLHRKLQSLGTTYQELLDSVRQELAIQYLAQANISTTEISFLLGYSNSNSFARAFRQWTGRSPREYRTTEL